MFFYICLSKYTYCIYQISLMNWKKLFPCTHAPHCTIRHLLSSSFELTTCLCTLCIDWLVPPLAGRLAAQRSAAQVALHPLRIIEEEIDRRKGKGRRCCLGNILECRTSQQGWIEEKFLEEEHPFWRVVVWRAGVKHRWSSVYLKHPFCQAFVLLFIPFFKSSWCYIYIVRSWNWIIRRANSSDDLCFLFCLFLLLLCP